MGKLGGFESELSWDGWARIGVNSGLSTPVCTRPDRWACLELADFAFCLVAKMGLCVCVCGGGVGLSASSPKGDCNTYAECVRFLPCKALSKTTARS